MADASQQLAKYLSAEQGAIDELLEGVGQHAAGLGHGRVEVVVGLGEPSQELVNSSRGNGYCIVTFVDFVKEQHSSTTVVVPDGIDDEIGLLQVEFHRWAAGNFHHLNFLDFVGQGPVDLLKGLAMNENGLVDAVKLKSYLKVLVELTIRCR